MVRSPPSLCMRCPIKTPSLWSRLHANRFPFTDISFRLIYLSRIIRAGLLESLLLHTRLATRSTSRSPTLDPCFGLIPSATWKWGLAGYVIPQPPGMRGTLPGVAVMRASSLPPQALPPADPNGNGCRRRFFVGAQLPFCNFGSWSCR